MSVSIPTTAQTGAALIAAINTALALLSTALVWTAFTGLYQSTWANKGGSYLTGGYRKDPVTGIVHMRGTIFGPDGIAIILPAGCRPVADCGFAAIGNSAFAGVRIDTVGNVYIVAGSGTIHLSLDGISFATT